MNKLAAKQCPYVQDVVRNLENSTLAFALIVFAAMVFSAPHWVIASLVGLTIANAVVGAFAFGIEYTRARRDRI